MSQFLSSADVKKLTGYERPSAQLRYCRENGVQAWLSAANEVVIPVCAITGKPQPANDSWSPDFTRLKRTG